MKNTFQLGEEKNPKKQDIKTQDMDNQTPKSEKELLTKEEAAHVMGLNPNFLRSDLETRYATLIKRYRNEQDNEKLEEISFAYNILTDRYIQKVEDTPRQKKIVLGKSVKEWGNFWFYNRAKIITFSVLTVLLVSVVYSIVTNKPADFKIATVGYFTVTEQEEVSDYILQKFSDFKKVDVSSAFIGGLDAIHGNEAAGQQKAMILMTVSGEDLIVTDIERFYNYATLGAFLPLDDFYEEIEKESLPSSISEELSPLLAAIRVEEGQAEEKHIYGISLGDSQLLGGLGIHGREQILTVSVKSKRPDLAKKLILMLLEDADKLLPLVTPIPPSPMPTALPTPTPTPAPESIG